MKNPDQIGWIHERYINLLMYDGIVDYIDNINYSGLFNHVRSYGIDKLTNLHSTLKYEVLNNQFAILWVDEYYLSISSYRFKKCHFVHPLIAYDYLKDCDQFDVIFFDITQGQILTHIPANQLYASVAGVKQYFSYGGTSESLTQTLSVFNLNSTFKGDFHLDVFIKNLLDYLYCQKDNSTAWYTLQRRELYNNSNVIYGIQIYQALIDELNSPNCSINYKTLHDFIKHKQFLFEKFRYIENNYKSNQLLGCLIEQFDNHSKKLEKIRLLNIKYQIKAGYFPASLSADSKYKEKLISVLKEGYHTELLILPQIIEEFSSMQYHKDYSSYKNMQIIEESFFEPKDSNTNHVKRVVFNNPFYSNRIDVINKPSQTILSSPILAVNDNYKYLIKPNCNSKYSSYSINIPTMLVKKLEFKSIEPFDISVNLIPLMGQDTSGKNFNPELIDKFDGLNQMVPIFSKKDGCRFIINNGDPFIYKTGLAINASYYRKIFVEMKVVSTCKKAQIFFSEVGKQSWSPQRMVEFSIIPDGEYHSYTINMQVNQYWTAFVGGIRFDPADYDLDFPFLGNSINECTISKFFLITD